MYIHAYMIINQPTYETQVVPAMFCRKHFGSNRKLLWVYLIFRSNGLGSAGWTGDAVEFLKGKGIASSTASRYILKLEKLGWIHRQNGAVRVASVHKLTETKNRYAFTIHPEWLDSYKKFQLYMFSTILLNKFQSDFKFQNRNKSVALYKESDKKYRSYDLHTALTTEEVAAEYIGISQSTFNRLKKSAAKAGMLKSKGAVCKKIKFNSEEDALMYLEMQSKSGRIQNIDGVFYIVVGTKISINRLLCINKYSQVNKVS